VFAAELVISAFEKPGDRLERTEERAHEGSRVTRDAVNRPCRRAFSDDRAERLEGFLEETFYRATNLQMFVTGAIRGRRRETKSLLELCTDDDDTFVRFVGTGWTGLGLGALEE